MHFCKLRMAPALIFFLCLWGITSTTNPAFEAFAGENPPASLRPLFGHALCFDDARGQVILFGGAGIDRIPLGETWSWNGRTWKLASPDGPSPRLWPAMAYDSKRERVILFGGRQRNSVKHISLSDTWAWDGNTWQQLTTEGPLGRDHHKMVYDPSRDRIVLFGGWNHQQRTNLGDTWEFDGKIWTQQPKQGPAPRAAHGLAFDKQSQSIILFGGRTLEAFFDDTWMWKGGRWTEKPVPGPSPRAFHAMAPESTAGNIILFGGRLNRILQNDTWRWDGSAWKKISDSGPSKRGVYSMVFDPKRNQVLFYGGGHREGDSWKLYADTWRWDGLHWRRGD